MADFVLAFGVLLIVSALHGYSRRRHTFNGYRWLGAVLVEMFFLGIFLLGCWAGWELFLAYKLGWGG